MERIVTVVTTLNDREVLERIGLHLVESGLVACMQIVGPVRSIYRWKGRLEQTDEWIGIMKTVETRYDAVEREIRRLHPYEVPEIGAIAMERVLPSYGEWLVAGTALQST